MKDSEHTKELSWDLDPSWGSSLPPAARLCLNALDFSDLWDEGDLGTDSPEDEGTSSTRGTSRGVQPPPAPPPPPPPPSPLFLAPPKGPVRKCGTLKLHWRELRTLAPLPRTTRFGSQTIWAGLEPVHLDTNRLRYLFESKTGSTCFNGVCRPQVRRHRWQ